MLILIAGPNAHLGQNGGPLGYLGGFSLQSTLLFEVVATALFAIVILGATGATANTAFAGLAIGITLAAICAIQVTSVSVNPARSFGPAIGALIFRLRALDA